MRRIIGTDRNAPIEMELDTIFSIRSMTKPLLGTAIQVLIDRKKLSLDSGDGEPPHHSQEEHLGRRPALNRGSEPAALPALGVSMVGSMLRLDAANLLPQRTTPIRWTPAVP